jgi:hypothetical protein
VTLLSAEPVATFDLSGIEPWPPTRYTLPLTPDFSSWWERYREVFRRAWWAANGYCLERWQEQLLHAITEVDSFGILRYREVLISVGRQNGKTEIVAALGLLFMVAKRTPTVISVASSREQAQLVYKRALDVATRSPSLAPHFSRMTNTRGLTTVTGGAWELKAAKSAALQGIPIDLGAGDEIHLMKPELWSDMVNGLGDRDDCMVVGITTAGDDDSELLKRLYEADDAPAARFGRFVWEAPEARMPDDDDTLARWLAMANPGIASGRRKITNAVSAARGMPPGAAIRYRLNRFLSGSENSFIAPADWNACAAGIGKISRPVITIDRSPDWKHASIVAAGKADDGTILVDVVNRYSTANVDKLLAACQALMKHEPTTFVVDGYAFKPLVERLKHVGIPVRTTSLGDEKAAAALAYKLVHDKRVRFHDAENSIGQQLVWTVRKADGEAYRLTRVGGQPIDTVVAAVRGMYIADTTEEAPMQVFF